MKGQQGDLGKNGESKRIHIFTGEVFEVEGVRTLGFEFPESMNLGERIVHVTNSCKKR